jgi:DNA-binding NarL/FixJ family response regulator
MHANRHPDRRNAIRIVVIADRRLDGEALAALLSADHEFTVIHIASSTDDALEYCRFDRPELMLCDATLADRESWHGVAEFLRHPRPVPVLLLDDELNLGRLAAALQLPAMGYYTRGATYAELADGLRRLAAGERAFEAAVRNRLEQTARGWKIEHTRGNSPLDRLTPRETQVLRLIALGRSVRDCAGILDLAQSTVENHKSRLMKKLGVRKSQELTRLAIREGLIRI